MKRKMKLYLDTSVISALFDERNPERKSLTESFFKGMKDYEIFISEITVAEIERTPEPVLQIRMKEVISPFSVLALTEGVDHLATEYIRNMAIPEGYPEDAYHIAIAVVKHMDFLLSWNFRHIVRRRTKEVVRTVNTMNKFGEIEIITPAELL
jgi:predicted nucleic acid-binding protein